MDLVPDTGTAPVRTPALPMMEPEDLRLDGAIWAAHHAAYVRQLALGDDPELATIREAMVTAGNAFSRLRAKRYGVPV